MVVMVLIHWTDTMVVDLHEVVLEVDHQLVGCLVDELNLQIYPMALSCRWATHLVVEEAPAMVVEQGHQESHYPKVLVVSLPLWKVATSHPEGLAKD